MDELLARTSPHSTEAEQAVLGSMLIDAGCVPDVIEMIRPEDFYISTNREIFETIYSMFNFSQAIDPVTLLEQMRENGAVQETTQRYLLDLMSMTPTAANVLEYARILRDKSLLRAISDAGSGIAELAQRGEGGAETILEAAEKRIFALRQGRSVTGLEPVSKVLAGVYERITEASQSGSAIPGLTTGLYDLDSAIMGLNDSDLVLIASRPGMGKTSIGLNIALHVAKSTGKAVAVYSLEMSREQLAMRLLSSESFIDGKKLQTGRLQPSDWKKLARAAASISSTNLLINDNPTLSVADMNAQCRRINNLGLVVIDYLQLMQSAKGTPSYSGENRTTAVSEISRMMKIMAKELNVPVICLSQLSRANESRQNKRPLLSDLRESGAIEQDADIVIGLYREDYYTKETDSANLAECIILKNRRGETGTIELQWVPEYTSYMPLEQRHTDEDAPYDDFAPYEGD